MKYKIHCNSMLGTTHSWAVTMRHLLTEMIDHDLYIESINGVAHVEPVLLPFLGREIDDPDIDICYTMPRNFESRFLDKAKIKMAIYNYETSKLPAAWVDKHKFVDYILPSSSFSKKVFVDAGWPSEKCIVVPHGINLSDFDNKDKYRLKTNKTFKFLNISINHYRKNIDLLIAAYYDAFTSNDDVCLVIKTNIEDKKGLMRFEFNFIEMLKTVQKMYITAGRKNLPAIEVISEKLDSMIPLYNSCDVLISASSSEGFGLPLLEGLAANKIVIAPRCTGQLDFLNDKNSILLGVKEILADARYQYWTESAGATTFLPIKKQISETMIDVYINHKKIKACLVDGANQTAIQYSWSNAASKIIDIAYENI